MESLGSCTCNVHLCAGALPCLESACRDLSQQAKLEAEFDAIVDLVSEAIHGARQQHQKSGIKVLYIYVWTIGAG